MKFAENNRISHRQLYRQIILSFSAPFLLCLFGNGKIAGLTGVAAVFAAAAVLAVYMLFLIRQESCYANLNKYAGRGGCVLAGMFFLIYILLTAAYLLNILGEIVPETLVMDVSGNWIMLFALFACSMGTHKGMQRRGRVADVTGGIFTVILLLILLMCAGQGNREYLEEMIAVSGWNTDEFLRSGYGMLCAFSGISLLPFLLEYVEKSAGAWKPAVAGIFTVTGIMAAMLILLPAILGWSRVNMESWPVLPLLAGAAFPGNVLSRFDILWMGFLLFSLLFSLGSLLHYGHLVIRKTNLFSGKYWLSAVVFVLAVFRWEGKGIREYYGDYLAWIFVPVLIVVQLLLVFAGKEKRRKRAGAAACVLMMLFLGGCGGVEPEKRIYPLALGVDYEDEEFIVTYGMADLPEATGQDKPEENGNKNVFSLTGGDFQEIDELYNRSQEKYQDLGHLEILILGENLVLEEAWEPLLEYLKGEPFVGENIYVFQAENPGELVNWKSEKGASLGEYIMGIMENRTSGQQYAGVTLREVYYQIAKDATLPELPAIMQQQEELEILWE